MPGHPRTDLIGVNTCKCECHKDGVTIFEFMPCCGLHQKKYIDKDGEIDNGRLYLLNNPPKPRKRKKRKK